MNNSSELKKYLNGFAGTLALSIFLLIIGAGVAGGVLSDFDSEELVNYLIVGISAIMCIVGLFIFKTAIDKKKDLDKTFRDLTECGLMNLIVNDFNTAKITSADKGRLGNNYVFIKKDSTFFTYDKIVQVFEYVHRTNFVVDERAVTIRYIDKDEKIKEVKIPVGKPIKNKDEPKEIMLFILAKNPNIKVGYTATYPKK